jgi:hypothetical protein
MFATSYCRNVKLSGEDAQSLANELAGTLHLLLTGIEKVIDATSMELEGDPCGLLIKNLNQVLKDHIRNGMKADWDDDDGSGDRPEPITPVPILSGVA